MLLDKDSRFTNTPLLVGDDGEYFGNRKPIQVEERADDTLHEVTAGDRIDNLAKKYLGKKKYWWVIADYNGIAFPLEPLRLGTKLRIPSRQYFEMHIIR